MRINPINLAAASILLATTTAANAGDIFVNAANNLQAVINSASDGDRIILQPGFDYNQTITITGKSLTIEGETGSDNITMTGNFLNDTVIVIYDAPEPGVTIRSITIRDGRTPSSGSAVGYPYDGGGLYAEHSTLLLEDVVFTANHANDDGGGAYFEQCDTTLIDCHFVSNTSGDSGAGMLAGGTTGSIDVTNCTFEDNEADGTGGGSYFSSPFIIRNSTFTNNRAIDDGRGGAVRLAGAITGTFEDCTFDRNQCDLTGGAIDTTSAGNYTFRGCDFTENTAEGPGADGGAMMYDGPAVTFDDCTFTRNTSLDNGGAVYAITNLNVYNSRFYGNTATRGGGFRVFGSTVNVDNSVFVGNTAFAYGGAIYAANTSGRCTVRNSTMVANIGDLNQGGIGGQPSGTRVRTVTNCIAWDNLPAPTAIFGGPITYSNISTGGDVVPGTGNIIEAPLFISAPSAGADMMWGTADDNYGDLRLAAGSPGIDAGDSPTVLDMLADADGNSRCVDDPMMANTGVIAWDLNVDMGAFEYQPEPAGPTCPGDVTNDGIVNFTDLDLLLANWNTVCDE